ncbi:tRNA (adenosine(37)-N6)-dimethylallyltransferase MiaA [Dethiothermospora halolimnae]|uniref:tRNA (adenosine(37)-N6)-dimethylallyltransferase MiaA n=1 Tax=Dethiothermospora halolimnae TaxID=3114390 RepID=UPI003CCBDB4E
MTKKKPLFILVGPTAVGKTSTSINLAKQLNGEIISADSMQIYKYMDIGTAKVTDEEKQGIKHYLVDEIFPNEKFSAADFQKRANKYISQILVKDKMPIVVGGTGLYVNSLVYDLDFTKAISNNELRKKFESEASRYGNDYVMEKLKEVDLKSAKRIHINDTKRIIRALEVYHETGKPMSESYNNFRKPNPLYDIAFVGLYMDRKKLYDRINYRVDKMIEEGLIDEVKNLINMGYDKDLASMQGLGYKEIINWLDGKYDFEEAIRILKRDSRRFAKRQLTWFRRDNRIKWFDVEKCSDKKDLSKNIANYVRKKLNY